MKFAKVNGNKVEAQRGLRGTCRYCESEMIAKCGLVKVWHWAHKRTADCDHWWENETEWHRKWKEHFPDNWQEVIHTDTTGEKHIADIKAKNGFVIEFQHSAIKASEVQSREAFYGKMAWVVDGTRLKRDYPRFQKGFGSFKRTNKIDYYLVPNPEKCLPVAWLNSRVSVFFDFLGFVLKYDQDQKRNVLWQLHPDRKDGNAIIVALTRNRFVDAVLNGPQLRPPAPANQGIPQNSR